MRKRRTRPGEDLIILLLFALVAVQLYFVLTGGPQTVVPLSRQEDPTALQGRDPSVPQHDSQARPIGNHPQPAVGGRRDPLAGAPTVGGQPVALGEGAPVNLPERMGLPKDPQDLVQPGQGEVSGSRPPGQESYGHGKLRFGQGGVDAYREMLMAIYLLERQGGKYALTPAQARHMLTLIRQMEDVKEAVPATQELILSTLNDEQLDFIRAQRSIGESMGEKFSPEEMDRYAREALEKLGGKT